MITVDAMGKVCPVPVVMTKKAIAALAGAETVEILVDNETSVQNLTKMAQQMQYENTAEKIADGQYRVTMKVTADQAAAAKAGGIHAGAAGTALQNTEDVTCSPKRQGDVVVAVSSRYMGTGDDALGEVLIKSFFYSLTQLDELPATILFYNGGAFLTCEGSPVLEDVKTLEAQGVEILTCGTCLGHYGIKEKLSAGDVTNMYVIVEKQSKAGVVIRP